MNDSLKTSLFVLAALLTLGSAIAVYYQSQPLPIDDFQQVGQPFYEQFDDAKAAKALEVTAIDPETATVQRFKVEQVDGLWTIPSHHNYPAEAADRLAATASSVMGLTRESLVGRVKADHERLGVLDPLDENTLDPEFAGQRISITDGSGDVLVDLIVGKQAGEVPAERLGGFDGPPVSQNYYYVRKPDENQTYKAQLDIDLSTRFSDWIRPDLLQIDPAEVRQINIDNYEMKEERANPLAAPQLYKMQGEQFELTRDGDVGPWDLRGLDEKTGTLQSPRVDQLVTELDALKIVGVRPKTLFDGLQILTPKLKLNPEVVQRFKENPQDLQNLINQVQFELKEYGFNLAPGPKGADDLMLVSETGEMSVGTDKGVVYALQFGKPVSGQESSIEIGTSTEQTAETKGSPDQPQPLVAATAGEADAAPVDNRFLMIRVKFNENLIPGKPTRPTPPQAPVPPPGYEPPRETGEKPSESATGAETEQKDSEEQSTQKQDPEVRDPAFLKYDKALKSHEEEAAVYELALTRFEDEQAEHDARVKEGKKRVAALNERYGPWFYVISGSNLETLKLDREQLIQPVTPDPGAPGVPSNSLPQRPDINFTPLPKTPNPSPKTAPEDGKGTPEKNKAAETGKPGKDG